MRYENGMQDAPLKREQKKIQFKVIQNGEQDAANRNCEDGARKNNLSHPLDSFEAKRQDLPGKEVL